MTRARFRGQRVIIARPFNHLGPGQSPNFVVPALVSRLLRRTRSWRREILVGDLSTRRDFSDVRDVVRAYRLLATLGVSGEVYNVASGHDVALLDIAAPTRRAIRATRRARGRSVAASPGRGTRVTRQLRQTSPGHRLGAADCAARVARGYCQRSRRTTARTVKIVCNASLWTRGRPTLQALPTSLEELMDSRAPAVVAVIVTTGPGPGLEAAAASLAAQNYEELSLLVLANGDAPHVAERVAAVAPHAFVRLLEENRGFGAACNEAALMVEGSAFFLFCHDDVRLEPDAVHLMVEAAYRTNAGIVTPKVVAYEDPLVLLHVGQTSDRFGVVRERIEKGEIDHGQQDLERDVFVAPGGVTLVRADLFATLRGFDPLISLLGEDLDLCWRAQVAGARIVVAPLAKVAHRETIATGERPVTAIGTRRASRQDLQRRHQLLVVATGWGPRYSAHHALDALCPRHRRGRRLADRGRHRPRGRHRGIVALALQATVDGFDNVDANCTAFAFSPTASSTDCRSVGPVD